MSAARRVPLCVPDLGPAGRSQARIVQWLIDEGSTVACGERILELLADGVLFHVSSEAGGVLTGIQGLRGTAVRQGETLAWIEFDDDG